MNSVTDGCAVFAACIAMTTFRSRKPFRTKADTGCCAMNCRAKRQSAGYATLAGAEVRVYSTDGALLGTRLVPTGDGYGSQGVVPVYFGLTTGAGASASP